MYLSWGTLALLCLAGALAWFWQNALAARERANAAAQEACKRLSLQFLDGTVVFARLSLKREYGRLLLRRTYVFDYTANSIERRQGFVILAGQRIEAIGYDPGEPLRPAAPPPPPPMPQGPSAVVFDLDQWRARRDERLVGPAADDTPPATTPATSRDTPAATTNPLPPRISLSVQLPSDGRDQHR